LAKEPSWVLDYVIVHELAHLHVRGHDKAFWELVNRYPLAERARGFLIARGLEPEVLDAAQDAPAAAPAGP
jgi:predicted metal-dependent hydrolase